MTEKIKEALSKLDPENDNHWTADGAPRMETVRMLAGNGGLTRDEVVAADQEFTRTLARKRVADAAHKIEDDKRIAGETAMAQNVDATGAPSGVPSVGMPGGAVIEGVTATSAAPGEMLGLGGTTANPTAESDNQLGTEETADLVAQQNSSAEELLKRQIAAGEDYLGGLLHEKEELEKRISTVTTQLDSLKSRVKDAEPDHLKNMATIQAYLQSSQQKRDARADLARQDSVGKLHVPRQFKEPVDQTLEARKRDASGQHVAIKKT
jgi:hypothetical protein